MIHFSQQAIGMDAGDLHPGDFVVPAGGGDIHLHIVGRVAGVEIPLGFFEQNFLPHLRAIAT